MNVELKLGSQTYDCKATFSAIAKIEQTLGRGAYTLGVQAAGAELQLREVAVIVQAMLATANCKRSVENIGDELMQEGAKDVLGPVSRYLLSAFAGPSVFENDRPLSPKATEPEKPLLQ